MKTLRNVIAASAASLAVGLAAAAGSPGVEHNTQAFLEALAKGGGKPLEALEPAEARQVLVGAAPASCPRPTSAKRPSRSMASRRSTSCARSAPGPTAGVRVRARWRLDPGRLPT
jgi:hypothetical protein